MAVRAHSVDVAKTTTEMPMDQGRGFTVTLFTRSRRHGFYLTEDLARELYAELGERLFDQEEVE